LRTVAKRHDSVHGVKYDRVINHSVIVKFAQIFYFCKTSLVELKVVLLQTENNVLENIINDYSDKILVISVQGTN
jgi:hypothetical protein